MQQRTRRISSLREGKQVEVLPGIFRTTMSYNSDLMLCHFEMRKGAAIALHKHVAAQNGYVINGRVRFLRADGSSFVAEAGDGYVFDSEEYHGAEVLEDTCLIECFAPMRTDCLDL